MTELGRHQVVPLPRQEVAIGRQPAARLIAIDSVELGRRSHQSVEVIAGTLYAALEAPASYSAAPAN